MILRIENCYGCKFFTPPFDGDYGLESFAEPESPSCNEPHLVKLADENENAAILIENIVFTLSSFNNCPFRQSATGR